MVSAPWTKFVQTKQVKPWPELGHFTLNEKPMIPRTNFHCETTRVAHSSG